jgi:hypothetical protein
VRRAGELQSQAERYRWLAQNIDDEQVKAALEAVAAQLDKEVARRIEPQPGLSDGREC